MVNSPHHYFSRTDPETGLIGVPNFDTGEIMILNGRQSGRRTAINNALDRLIEEGRIIRDGHGNLHAVDPETGEPREVGTGWGRPVSDNQLASDPDLDSYIGFSRPSATFGRSTFSDVVSGGSVGITSGSGHSSYGGCKKCWYYSMLFGGSSDGGVGTRSINSEEDFEIAKQEYVDHFNESHKDIMLKRDKPDNSKVFKEVEQNMHGASLWARTVQANAREEMRNEAREIYERYTWHISHQRREEINEDERQRRRD